MHVQREPQFVPVRKSSDGLAVASLVLGILWIVGIGSILAVAFGHTHLSRAKRGEVNQSGMAIAGLVLGYVGIAGAAILIIGSIVAANTANNLNNSVNTQINDTSYCLNNPGALYAPDGTSCTLA